MKLPNDKFECTECENVYGNSHMVAINPKTDEHWCEWCGYEDEGEE